MNLNNYVKYFACVLFAHLHSVNADLVASDANENQLKQSRGIIDLVVGRLRPCGSCLCGRANRAGRFTEGEHTDPHEFPWLANIYVKSQDMFNGVLINDRYVLTAASPFENVTSNNVKVSLGQYNRCSNDVSSSNSSVENLIVHHSFDYFTKSKDIALLRLSRPIKFEKRIFPVCLPNPGSTYLGQVGTVVGWPETNDKKSCRPRKVGLPILGKKECYKGGVESEKFHDDSGCIGVLKTNSIACSDDAGSPLLYRSYNSIYDLVGVLSEANQCEKDEEGLAIYTKVGPNLDWILKHTKDACYCTK